MPRADNRFYDLLEVAPDASQRGLQAAARRVLERLERRAAHDRDAADRLAEARVAAQVLADPARRRLYDRFGERILDPDFRPPEPPVASSAPPAGDAGVEDPSAARRRATGWADHPTAEERAGRATPPPDQPWGWGPPPSASRKQRKWVPPADVGDFDVFRRDPKSGAAGSDADEAADIPYADLLDTPDVPRRRLAITQRDLQAPASAAAGPPARRERQPPPDDAVELWIPFRRACLGGNGEALMDGEVRVIPIPPGTDDGDFIPVGTTVFVARIDADRELVRVGQDIHAKLVLSHEEAQMGCEAISRSLEGHLSVEVPPAAKTGQKLRLEGYGVPDASGARGDMILTIEVKEGGRPRVRGFGLNTKQ